MFVTAVCLFSALGFPLYFVNSLRLCFLSPSFLSFLRQFFNFFVFLSRSFSFLRHCCVLVFRCRSFSFLRRCYLIVFRSSTVFRQFTPTLFAFSVVLCLSHARCFLCVPKSFFSFLTSLLCVSSLGFPLYFVAVVLSLSDFVCFLCRSLSFLRQVFNFFVFVSRSFSC